MLTGFHGGDSVAPIPSVASVNPSPITTAGQAGVTITGNNFSNASAVTFGGTNATSFTVNSATSITAAAPAKSGGTYNVVVTTPFGTSPTTTSDQIVYNTPAWAVSQSFPATDVNSQTMSGTELRALAALNPYTSSAALYAVTGMSESPSVPPGGQILVLNAAPGKGGQWKVDKNLNTLCSGLSLTTDCFATNADMEAIKFTSPSATTILTVGPITSGNNGAAGCGSGLAPTYTFSKNNTDGVWNPTQLSCDASNNQIRAYSPVAHTDAVTGTQYAFAGEDPVGVFSGVLNSNQGAGQNPITWSTTPEFLVSSLVGPSTCSGGQNTRIVGLAAVTGADGVEREYMTVCLTVYVRVDGPSPGAASCGPQQVDVNGNCVARWQPYWYSVNFPTSGSARALSALTEDSPEDMLLGFQGGSSSNTSTDQGVWRIPALCPSSSSACTPTAATNCGDYNSSTGVVTTATSSTTPSNAACSTNEYLWHSELASLTGITPADSVGVYNEFTLFYDNSGNPNRAFGFTAEAASPSIPPNSAWSYMWDGGGNPRMATGGYLTRTQGAVYGYVYTPDSLFSTPQEGSRTVAPSPFLSENAVVNGHYVATAMYLGGFDVQSSANNAIQWCQPSGTACPGTPTLVATANTAWIARNGP